MAFDRFMIAPMNSGLQADLKPWIIPDDAFARLQNAYIFRGRLRKRFGTQLMNQGIVAGYAQLYSRLRVNIATTNSSGNYSGAVPLGIGEIGQLFSIGNSIYTAYQVSGTMLISDGVTATATFNTTNGSYVFAGAPAMTKIYWYPATPVMGIFQYETAQSTSDPTYVFDTQYCYYYLNGGWEVLGPTPNTAGSGVWTGDDSQFFWTTTWNGESANLRYFFVTNNNIPDGLKYYDQTNWINLNPPISVVDGVLIKLVTALILVAFKNRLLALNTTESVTIGLTTTSTDGSGNKTATPVAAGSGNIGDYFSIGQQTFQVVVANGALLAGTVLPGQNAGTGTFNTANGQYTFSGAAASAPIYYYPIGSAINNVYTNRVRWSAFGDPTATLSWRSDVPGNGNALDAATLEDIVSCEFVKDRLIVFFERSTWELVYTNNQAQPFTWQKLNTELGAESPWSTVPFDKFTLTVGNTGIHACNGVNVERVDSKIPDEVWTIKAGSTEVPRVYGIRDYYAEQVYWTFPNVDSDPNSSVYPQQVLAYNYKTGSWALFDDSFTAFGYFYASNQSQILWSSQTVTWENTAITWGSGTQQPLNQDILGGNQEGFVLLIDADYRSNAPSLQITNLTIVNGSTNVLAINHNFNFGDYVQLNNLNGLTGPFTGFYKITSVVDANNFIILAPDVLVALATQVYIGGGTIARVSQVDILTKQYNFYIDQDRNTYLQKVDFLVDRTAASSITVDFLVGTSYYGLLEESIQTGAVLGTSILETSPYPFVTYEQQQERLWHPLYFQADGNAVQLRLYFSDAQLANGSVAYEDFQLHAMTFYMMASSSRAQ